MMAQQNDQGTGSRMFDLNRPQGFAKDEYLYSFTHEREVVFDLIRNNRNQPNNRDVVHAVMFAISLIAHDHIRKKQEVLFAEALNQIKNSKLNAEEKSDEIMRVCAITMGNLTSYVDQFRGLAHTLKVGELYNFDKPYAHKKLAWGEDGSDTIQL